MFSFLYFISYNFVDIIFFVRMTTVHVISPIYGMAECCSNFNCLTPNALLRAALRTKRSRHEHNPPQFLSRIRLIAREHRIKQMPFAVQ